MGKPRRRAPRDRSDGDGDASRKESISTNPGNAGIGTDNSRSSWQAVLLLYRVVYPVVISAHGMLAQPSKRDDEKNQHDGSICAVELHRRKHFPSFSEV